MTHDTILKAMKHEVVKDYLMEENIRKANFIDQMSFGTGGVRGPVGIGTDKMNDVTVATIILDISHYIKNLQKETKGVLIYFDTRHGSLHFAKLAAMILDKQGIHVEIADKAMPTPALSYSMIKHDFFLGIVVTASHNPYMDIGIKVYNEVGNQMTEHDLEVMEKFMSTTFELSSNVLAELKDFNLESSDILEKEYKNYLLNEFKAMTTNLSLSDINCVYSPLHGAGSEIIPELLADFDFIDLNLVEQQMELDGFFKTVASPNPENLESFQEAFELADEIDGDIVLITDPDADRLGAAEKNEDQWNVFTGNELGGLFVAFLSEINWKNKHNYILSSVVSSDLTDEIAKKKGLKVKKTLTGFKYMGELLSEGLDLFFAYEESGGFLLLDKIRDKDAVQAVILFSIMKAYYKHQNLSLMEKLETLYEAHGIYQSNLYSFKEIDANKIYHDTIEQKKRLQLSKIEDYKNQKVYENEETNDFTDYPEADLLKVYLDNNEWIAFRPSGTEDKFKVYTQSWGNTTAKLNASNTKIKEILKQLEINV